MLGVSFIYNFEEVMRSMYSYVGDLLTSGQLFGMFTPDSSNLSCVIVNTSEDTILESDESYIFSLSVNDPAITAIIPNMGQISIIDNDSKLLYVIVLDFKVKIIFTGVQALFTQAMYREMEDSVVPLLVCVELQGSLEVSVQVDIEFQTDTATSQDFTNVDNITGFIFNAGSVNSQCFQVIIEEDELLENEEFFQISLSSPDEEVDIHDGVVEVTILDTSELFIGFESTADSISEGGSLSICIRIFSGRLANGFVLPLKVDLPSGQGIEGLFIYKFYVSYTSLMFCRFGIRNNQ